MAPADGADIPNEVDVRATLIGENSTSPCASVDVPVEVRITDSVTNLSWDWDLYCTFESCKRDGVVVNWLGPERRRFFLSLVVSDRDVHRVSVYRQ